ncbi:MAG: hypothetical protein ACM3X0_07205 [Bacteroidota bacterium]
MSWHRVRRGLLVAGAAFLFPGLLAMMPLKEMTRAQPAALSRGDDEAQGVLLERASRALRNLRYAHPRLLTQSDQAGLGDTRKRQGIVAKTRSMRPWRLASRIFQQARAGFRIAD